MNKEPTEREAVKMIVKGEVGIRAGKRLIEIGKYMKKHKIARMGDLPPDLYEEAAELFLLAKQVEEEDK